MSTALAIPNTAENMRVATDAAGACKAIVTKTAIEIQNRKYVRVEGWMALATAHGCVASARDVEKIEGGFRAIGEIRRIDNGTVISTAEGFVGDDEPTWAKRPEYARRAMAQTRAISRACRSAFAHVVVLMDAGLETTPAEEIPIDVQSAPVGFAVSQANAATTTHREERNTSNATEEAQDWRLVPVPKFIKKYAGGVLGDMAEKDLVWWADNYEPKPFKGEIQQRDLDFKAALVAGRAALAGSAVSSRAGNDANADLEEADRPF